MGEGALKLVLLDPIPSPLSFAVVQNIWSAWRFPNPSMDQHREQTTHEKGFSIQRRKFTLNYPIATAIGFFEGTHE